MGRFVKTTIQEEPACIVFDGTSYYGIFEFDLETEIEENDVELISKYHGWTDEMDEEIERLNNEI